MYDDLDLDMPALHPDEQYIYDNYPPALSNAIDGGMPFTPQQLATYSRGGTGGNAVQNFLKNNKVKTATAIADFFVPAEAIRKIGAGEKLGALDILDLGSTALSAGLSLTGVGAPVGAGLKLGSAAAIKALKGAKTATKVAKIADKTADAAKAASKVAKVAAKTGDAAKAVKAADKVADTVKAADKLADVAKATSKLPPVPITPMVDVLKGRTLAEHAAYVAFMKNLEKTNPSKYNKVMFLTGKGGAPGGLPVPVPPRPAPVPVPPRPAPVPVPPRPAPVPVPPRPAPVPVPPPPGLPPPGLPPPGLPPPGKPPKPPRNPFNWSHLLNAGSVLSKLAGEAVNIPKLTVFYDPTLVGRGANANGGIPSAPSSGQQFVSGALGTASNIMGIAADQQAIEAAYRRARQMIANGGNAYSVGNALNQQLKQIMFNRQLLSGTMNSFTPIIRYRI